MTVRATFLAQVEAILGHLPGTWTMSPRGTEDDCIASADRNDGLSVLFQGDSWRNPRRVIVSPRVPMDGTRSMSLRCWGAIGYGEKEPTASAALTRKPAAIAGDIQRKVIAPYQPLFATIRSRQADRSESRSALQALTERMLATLGRGASLTPYRADQDSQTVHLSYGNGVWGNFDLASGSVRLQLHVNSELAVRIADVLANYQAQRA